MVAGVGYAAVGLLVAIAVAVVAVLGAVATLLAWRHHAAQRRRRLALRPPPAPPHG